MAVVTEVATLKQIWASDRNNETGSGEMTPHSIRFVSNLPIALFSGKEGVGTGHKKSHTTAALEENPKYLVLRDSLKLHHKAYPSSPVDTAL
jgi:hypothetical protein